MFDVLLDGIASADFNLRVAERPKIPTAKQKSEKRDVDFRDGSLIRKKGYEDITVSIEFNILEMHNIKKQIRQIKKWMLDAKVMRFTDDSIFYKIKEVTLADVDNNVEIYGYFNVNFLCDPYVYEDEKTTIYSEKSITISNHTSATMLPRIKIVGTGTIKMDLNGQVTTLKDITDNIIIDSLLLEASIGLTINANEKMIGPFPIVKQGMNKLNITSTGTFSKIEITERWRWI